MKYAALLLLTILLPGCARELYLYEGEPVSDGEHAIIGMMGDDAFIDSIDGKRIFGEGQYFRLYLKPGTHIIDLFIRDNFDIGASDLQYRESSGSLTVDMQAGHKYEVGSRLVDGDRHFFVRDRGTDFNVDCYDVRYRNGVFDPTGVCPWGN